MRHWLVAGVFLGTLGCVQDDPTEEVAEAPNCRTSGLEAEFVLGNPGNRQLLGRAIQPQQVVPMKAPKPMPWTAGRALAAQEGVLFVVDAANGDLVRFDPEKMAVISKVHVGDRPEQVVVEPDGTVWVPARGDGALVRIVGDQLTSTKVGLDPVGLALSVDRSRAYVTLHGEAKLAVVDTQTLAVEWWDTEARPRAVVVSADDRVHVTHLQDPRVLIFEDNGPETLRALRTTNPWDEILEVDEGRPWRAMAAVASPEINGVYVTHVISRPGAEATELGPQEVTETTEVVSGGGYGGAPTTTVITSSKVVHTPDLPRPIELAVTRLVPGSDFEQPDLPVVNPFNDTVPHALIDSPSDIAHSPTHSLVAVTGFGSNNVLFAHPGNAWQPVGVADVGAGPRAAVFSDDGSALYVLNANALSISVVDVAPFLRESQQLPQHIAYSAASERAFGVDPLSPSLRNGRRVFANAHNAGLAAGQRFACVTCHPEGTQDGLVWVLPDGPRQTPSLTHRLEGTGPFNWHGTEDALQHNMAETIHRMGGLGLNCQELEDLEQFLLRGLPAPPPNPHVNDDGTLTPAQEAGQKLFFDETTACSECHSGATTTDGKLHDVGTSENQTRLNTPSLAGLYYTAPYLHDGSAADLFDVLEHTATTMGRTDHLTDDQKADLVAFLLTL